MKKSWIGKTLSGIGLVHTIFGLVVFHHILWQWVRGGLFNTVNAEFDRNTAFWFLCAGFIWILLGIFINSAEKNNYPIPRSIGWGLLMITVFAVIIMPASGFWLLFVPAVGLIKKKPVIFDKK